MSGCLKVLMLLDEDLFDNFDPLDHVENDETEIHCLYYIRYQVFFQIMSYISDVLFYE